VKTQRDRDESLEIDIEHLLDYLGVHNVEKRGREVWFSCPFPGHKTGDSQQSASFRPADRHPWWMFNCFGCGSRGDAADFFAKHQGLPKLGGRSAAKQWLRDEYGTGYRETDLEEKLEKLRKIKEPKKCTKSTPEPIDESHQEERSVDWAGAWDEYVNDQILPDALAYLFHRGLTGETLTEWEVGFDPVTEMLSIPYRDEQGRLLGFKGRAWWEGARPRYMVLGNREGREDRFGFQTLDVSKTVHGIHKLAPGHRLIVVEGELNNMAMRQYGHGRTVGVSGQYLSARQIQIITSVCDEVVLIFDENEKAVRAARGDIERSIPGLVPKVHVRMVPARDCDPADASDELVASWLDAAVDPFSVYFLT
jgi:DNA primase